MEEHQPWVTCYLTDMLRSYAREVLDVEEHLDYFALFRGVQGLEAPRDPKLYLSDVGNWVPLSVLRELELQCEQISGKKDIAYHAAKAYFTPGKRPFPSLFEMIVQILNDVRSALAFSSVWGAAQTNYLKLQSFEKTGAQRELFILAQFAANAGPSIGALHLLRGFCEGFPQLYPLIERVECSEEISQLRIEHAVGEFPDYAVRRDGDALTVHLRSSPEPVVRAVKVRLATERVELAQDFLESPADAAVVAPKEGRIEVITGREAPRAVDGEAPFAYRIEKPGTLSSGPLTYPFSEGRCYNAPYSRYRVRVDERAAPQRDVPAALLRKQISHLLFNHLRHTQQMQVRIVSFNLEKSRLAEENARLRREIQRENSFAGIIAQSRPMQELFGLIRAVADTDATVLILGETGTGKELIARAIHYNSARKDKPFIAVNCGALASNLLESELFGHEKGAFTGAVGHKKGFFEVANGGTLFLDEIGEIPTSTQVKMLRVLQEGELQRVGGTDTIKVDVRIIAATNQNLEERIAKGEFRQDLYYRLKVFPLAVAPLRERAEDIPLLVSRFIEKCAQLAKRKVGGITPDAMAKLMAHSWPGNVRELENVVQRMMIVSKGDFLDVSELPPELRNVEPKSEPRGLKGISRESAGAVERQAILEALTTTGGNVTRAAKALGISRATLQTKMKLYRLREKKT
jgi:DNA-binding NtrC family response regulator